MGKWRLESAGPCTSEEKGHKKQSTRNQNNSKGNNINWFYYRSFGKICVRNTLIHQYIYKPTIACTCTTIA